MSTTRFRSLRRCLAMLTTLPVLMSAVWLMAAGPTVACSCVAAEWRCLACPATAPQPLGACTPQGLVCRFGAQVCMCTAAGDAPRWSCATP